MARKKETKKQTLAQMVKRALGKKDAKSGHKAVKIRKVGPRHVDEREIGRALTALVNGFTPATDVSHIVPHALEDLPQSPPDVRIVVNN